MRFDSSAGSPQEMRMAESSGARLYGLAPTPTPPRGDCRKQTTSNLRSLLDRRRALLTVVLDASFLRLIDCDDHCGHDGDAGQHIGPQFLLDIARLSLASGFELETPAAKRVRAQDEFRAHLLQALDAQRGHRVCERRNHR